MAKKILNFSEICTRYAKALISLQKDDKAIETTLTQLNSVIELKQKSEIFRAFLENPILAPEKKIMLLKKINKKLGLSNYIINFLLVLCEHNRLFAVERIYETLKSLISKRNNETKLELITTNKIDSDLEKNIKNKLSRVIDKKIKIDNIIDENIIGGMIIKIDSLMIDCSISSRLSELGNLEKGNNQ